MEGWGRLQREKHNADVPTLRDPLPGSVIATLGGDETATATGMAAARQRGDGAGAGGPCRLGLCSPNTPGRRGTCHSETREAWAGRQGSAQRKFFPGRDWQTGAPTPRWGGSLAAWERLQGLRAPKGAGTSGGTAPFLARRQVGERLVTFPS